MCLQEGIGDLTTTKNPPNYLDGDLKKKSGDLVGAGLHRNLPTGWKSAEVHCDILEERDKIILGKMRSCAFFLTSSFLCKSEGSVS